MVSQSPLIRRLSFPLQASTRREEATLGSARRAKRYTTILEGLLDGYVVRQPGRTDNFMNAFAGIPVYLERPSG